MSRIEPGLAAFPNVILKPNYIWTPSKANWTNYVQDVNPAFLSSVAISCVGQPDNSKEPAKTMSGWYTKNKDAITIAGFTGDELKVSSWAMVVDITFAKSAPKMYSAVQSGTATPVKALP